MASPVTNFGKVTVSTGYDAAATSIVLSSGHGSRLPTTFSFPIPWWNATDYSDPADDPQREIVTVTNRSTDTLTIVRGVEGTSASTKNTAGKTYKMVLSLTKAMWDSLPMPWGISGLTYQNNVTDATNDLDIVAGQCRDATNVDMLVLSALTKRSDAVWAVGTNAGMLDTGAVGNNNYYLWAIKRVDTGVTDVLSSLSSTAPTMPTNYTLKRLFGWFKRVGGTIVAFHTYEIEGGGLDYSWDSPTLDIDLATTLTTTRRTDALKVPLNFSVNASINVAIDDGSGPAVWIYCPDQADLAPSNTAAPLASGRMNVSGTPFQWTQQVRTSATGTIAARSNVATVDSYKVVTLGFTWARRT